MKTPDVPSDRQIRLHALEDAAKHLGFAVSDLRTFEDIGFIRIEIDSSGGEYLTGTEFQTLIRLIHDSTCPSYM